MKMITDKFTDTQKEVYDAWVEASMELMTAFRGIKDEELYDAIQRAARLAKAQVRESEL